MLKDPDAVDEVERGLSHGWAIDVCLDDLDVLETPGVRGRGDDRLAQVEANYVLGVWRDLLDEPAGVPLRVALGPLEGAEDERGVPRELGCG